MSQPSSRPCLHLSLSSGSEEVAVDLCDVQEIIHLREGGCAEWAGPGHHVARIRRRTIPVVDLNARLGTLPCETVPTRMVVVEIDRKLHAFPALHARASTGADPTVNLHELLRRSA